MAHPPAPQGFSLYLAPRQYHRAGTLGRDIREHLKKKGLFERCLSTGDPEVQEWIRTPSLYPESLKGKTVVL